MTTEEKIKKTEQDIARLRSRTKEKKLELKRLQDIYLIEQQEKRARMNDLFVSGIEEICGEMTEEKMQELIEKIRRETQG